MTQDGRLTALKPGDMALFSSTRLYEFSFDAFFSQTVLILPADALRLKIPGIDTLTATTLDGQNPAACLLSRMAESYFQTDFSQLPSRTAEHAADALTALLAATLTVFLPAVQASVSSRTLFHLLRIKQYAIDHLKDPALSIASISQALHLSPAHIHRVFEGESLTFSAWLRSCRLLACRHALEDGAQAHLDITQIAFKHGFNNSAHFSRAFREQFGICPRECRDRKATYKP